MKTECDHLQIVSDVKLSKTSLELHFEYDTSIRFEPNKDDVKGSQAAVHAAIAESRLTC